MENGQRREIGEPRISGREGERIPETVTANGHFEKEKRIWEKVLTNDGMFGILSKLSVSESSGGQQNIV